MKNLQNPHNKSWKKPEIEYLLENARKIGFNGVAKFLNRTESAVVNKWHAVKPVGGARFKQIEITSTETPQITEARTKDVTAKKLVINLGSNMTTTIEENGLITVDFS